MKKILLLLALATALFVGCTEAETKEIDKAAEEVKSLLDKHGKDVSGFIERNRDKLENSEETIGKLKDLIDKVADKTKEVSKEANKNGLRDQLEDTKNLIEKEGGGLLKELEGILKEFEGIVPDSLKREKGTTEAS